MVRRRKKSRWTLSQVRIEVNLLVARVGALFSKEPLPDRSRRERARKASRIVEAKYRVIQTRTPTNALSRARRSPTRPIYPVFGVDENGLPRNVIGDTIVGITSLTRAKAVRKGDSATALAAAIVEQVVVDAARKQREGSQESRW